jgi:hypothetical protein
MTMMNKAPQRFGGGLETVPLLLSGGSLGSRLSEQLIAIAASLGMTLLTLTASVA